MVSQVVDHQQMVRVLRSVKIWEMLLLEAISCDDMMDLNGFDQSVTSSPGRSQQGSIKVCPDFVMMSQLTSLQKFLNTAGDPNAVGGSLSVDPFDLAAAYCNQGITLW